MKTHEVTNQTPPMSGMNAYRGDPLLGRIADDFPKSVQDGLEAEGRFVLSSEAQDLARLANTELPKLRTHDRQGRRLDQVEFHPAYHALMRRSISLGLHASAWEDSEAEKGIRHQARATRYFLMSQLECGHLCPVTMTNASLAALMANPSLFREWAPLVVPRKYDPSSKPPAKKAGLTLGMGMTEKQGGTDVRANTTRAEPAGNGFYRITGHKWFMSAPMCDAFLVLAQAREGLSCFLLPRVLPDGSTNGFLFQRLKDKLGNRSNASSEVEFDSAIGQMVGNPGEGVKTIIDMVTLTRLDCAVSSAGIMRAALGEAVHHGRHRTVFQKRLIDQPLMTRVLADMALDVAAATALSLRLARAFDNAREDQRRGGFRPCHDAGDQVLDLQGHSAARLRGDGEPRRQWLYRGRQSCPPVSRGPVNAIWEGSGNVMALDVLRVLSRGPQLFDEVLSWIGSHLGRAGKGTMEVLRAAMQVAVRDEGSARILTEQLALAAAGAELRNLGLGELADAFIETRLAGQWRTTYGMLDARHDARGIVDSLYSEEA